ncbi:MAG TPA: hypothetical protein VE075_06340 [Thermoanaerobaculia bacterium]|nr:hypothetical protein [Thermoanaerobaculia bacterium]
MDPNTAAATPGQGQRKTSPWVYAGCGCAVLLVLAALVVLFVVKKVADQGHKIEQGLADPKVREQRTRELLSYRELPAGYYPAGAVSLPFLLDMAFLGDHPPAPGATHVDIKDHGFIFIKMHVGKIPTEARARRRMLYGTNGRAPWEQGSGFRIETHEPLGEGEMTAGGAHVVYRATRGDVHMNGRTHRGITSILMVECPDRHIRIGVWLGPDPAPGEPTASLEKTGTPADPRAITAFLDHFNLCAGGS